MAVARDGDASDDSSKEEPREYLKPGGVKKVSNAVVSGRGVGAMSYDPQVAHLPECSAVAVQIAVRISCRAAPML